MTRFSKLSLDANGKPVETDIREIPQSAMVACQHFIMVPEHYRDDGTCRCDDIKHTAMTTWGYAWDAMKHRWTSEVRRVRVREDELPDVQPLRILLRGRK